MDVTVAAPPIRRFCVLDTYRFLAAMGVVAYHYSHPWAPKGLDSIAPLTDFRLFVNFFFVLSGFVIMHTYGARMGRPGDYGRFMQKRLARVYPLHVATLMAYALMGLALLAGGYRFLQPEYLSPSAFLPNLLLVHAWGTTAQMAFNTPSWSLSAEFFLYLAFPLLLAAVMRLGVAGTLVLAVAFTFGMDAVRDAADLRHWSEATWDFGALRAVPSFLSGMAVQRLVTGRWRHIVVPWPVAHGIAVIVPVLMLLHAAPGIIVMASVVAVGALALAEMNGMPSRLGRPAFAALGDASYAVYMIHPLIGTALITMLPRLLGLGEGWKLPLTLLAVVAVVGGGILTFRLFEDPMRRWLGRPIAWRHARPRLDPSAPIS